MGSVLLQSNLGGRKFLKCNIDLVASMMNDRCLREKFVILSLAENVHKKIIYNQ